MASLTDIQDVLMQLPNTDQTTATKSLPSPHPRTAPTEIGQPHGGSGQGISPRLERSLPWSSSLATDTRQSLGGALSPTRSYSPTLHTSGVLDETHDNPSGPDTVVWVIYLMHYLCVRR
jgi:hypothetical protein